MCMKLSFAENGSCKLHILVQFVSTSIITETVTVAKSNQVKYSLVYCLVFNRQKMWYYSGSGSASTNVINIASTSGLES